LAVLSARESARAFSPWVKTNLRDGPGRRLLRQVLMGRPKVPVTCLLFWGLSIVLGVSTLHDQSLGVHQARTLTSMLVVLTSLGFGSVSLSAASVADDWPIIGREYLWGVGPLSQVMARFFGMALPAVVMGAATGLTYTALVGTKSDRFIGSIALYTAGLFALYALSCLALGIAISSLVGGVRSAVYLLMLLMSLLVLVSDVPFVIEDLEGAFGTVFNVVSYGMPSRYAAGAWAAGIGFAPREGRGWTWESTGLNISLDFLGLLVLTFAFLTVAAIRVHHEAPKYAS
jgi:hypothetical protein